MLVGRNDYDQNVCGISGADAESDCLVWRSVIEPQLVAPTFPPTTNRQCTQSVYDTLCKRTGTLCRHDQSHPASRMCFIGRFIFLQQITYNTLEYADI